MSSRTRKPEPLGAGPSPLADRLSSTLFVAALAHGVIILGITFSAGPLAESDALPSLNVTLVVDRRELDRPEDSQLLADANQQGGGQAPAGLRPTTALAADQPLTRSGDPGAADAADGQPREAAPPAEQLVTRTPNDERVNAVPKATDTPAAAQQSAAALLDLSAPQALAMEIDLRAELPDSDDSEQIPAPTTRESVLAAYLDGWRRRVERIGTVNFPERFRGDHGFGRPTLEVAIAADGGLAEIVVRQSSGNSALDQAAVGILRLAAPFDPLPDSIRADYDVLRFAYEWEFTADASAAASP
jgi:periplasmic protein TonB